MSASRNLGIRHAKGAYVAFLDADDVWLPDKLEQQTAILRAQPQAALVCTPVLWWYSWTGNLEDQGRDFTAALNVQTDSLFQPPELLLSLLQKETPTTTTSLIRRESLLRAGGFEQKFRGLYEDQVLFAKICSTEPAFVTSYCSYKWRKHRDSSCSNAQQDGGYLSARLQFLTWLERYLAEHGVAHRQLSRTVATMIWQSRHPRLSRIWDRVSHF